MVGVITPSHSVRWIATFYLASGTTVPGTVFLLHGLQGDLAQSIRQAGWNVLLFHYLQVVDALLLSLQHADQQRSLPNIDAIPKRPSQSMVRFIAASKPHQRGMWHLSSRNPNPRLYSSNSESNR